MPTPHLSWNNHEAVHRAVLELYSTPVTADGFPSHALSILSRLILSEHWAYTELHRPTKTLRGLISEAPSSFPESLARFDQIKERCEYYRYDLEARNGQARLLQDFLSWRQYRETEIYREVLHPCRYEWPIGVLMRGYGDQSILSFGLFRSGRRNFSERDRACMNLLLPHLARLHELACLRSKLEGHLPSPDDFRELNLTGREAEVLYWVADGKSNSEIARLLGRAEQTIKNHLHTIFNKLGVENRTAAMVSALRVQSRYIPCRSTLVSQAKAVA
jgi:DNA-binding CsgD family transcriptional regulator